MHFKDESATKFFLVTSTNYLFLLQAFFNQHQQLKSSFIIYFSMWAFGISEAISESKKKVIDSIIEDSEQLDWLTNTMITDWLIFWPLLFILGGWSGLFVWLIGGWFSI